MKNHRDLEGLGANILIAALILLMIIAALNKMGLYNLPPLIENFLNPQSVEEKNHSIDEDKIYNSAQFDTESSGEVEKVKISHENAREMLEKIFNKNDYRHEISVTHYAEGTSLTRQVVIEKKNSFYEADVYSRSATLLESYSETDDEITAQKYSGGKVLHTATYPKGSFTVPELCSVIADHKSFLDGIYDLQEGNFSVIHGDFGTELEIVFETVLENYSQTEAYRINVDYGIVTQAECTENGKLVYSMQTLSLKELAN